MHDARRITLIARGTASPRRAWNTSPRAANRIIFVDTFSTLCHALHDASQDVDRVLIDGTATPSEFLNLLATLPQDFLGDVLLICDGQSSYLSTTGRGNGRLLYAIAPADLRFYVETIGLVSRSAMAA